MHFSYCWCAIVAVLPLLAEGDVVLDWYSCVGEISTTINVGERVTWQWIDNDPHTVSCCDDLSKDCALSSSNCSFPTNSPILEGRGSVIQHTFTDVGEYPFYCQSQGQECQRGVVTVVLMDDEHEVTGPCRQCSENSCQFLNLDATQYGDDNVCGTSKMNGKCQKDKTFLEATDLCESNGMRLCTRSELENNEVRDTGCQLDNELVWSSTKCSDNSYYVVAGQSSTPQTGCLKRGRTSNVRCCADDLRDQSCCDEEDCRECSKRSCSDLGLPTNNAGNADSKEVCGDSKISGKCSKDANFESVKEFCEKYDMRLCTVYELENDETRDTGCGLDNELVWSDTECGDNSYYAAAGQSSSPQTECLEMREKLNGRCCADRDVDSQECCLSALSNDACSGAITLQPGNTIIGSTRSSSVDNLPSCAEGREERSGVWYRLRGNGETLVVTTCSKNLLFTDFDTEINVFEGRCSSSLANLKCVVENDDDSQCENDLKSTVEWLSEKGTEYYIFVSVFGYGEFEITYKAECTGLYNQCGGRGFQGISECCVIVTNCVVYSPDESICVPENDIGVHQPDTDSCAGTWRKCGGDVPSRPCCDYYPSCVKKSDNYYQCQPVFQFDQPPSAETSISMKLSYAAIVLGGASMLFMCGLLFLYFSKRIGPNSYQSVEAHIEVPGGESHGQKSDIFDDTTELDMEEDGQ